MPSGSGSDRPKRYISWGEIQQEVFFLRNKVRFSPRDVLRILAVARGGMVPAAMLASQLDVVTVHSLLVKSCTNEETFATQCEVEIEFPLKTQTQLDLCQHPWHNYNTLILAHL